MWRMSTGCLMSVSSFSRLSRSRNSRKFSLEYCVFMSFACAPRLFGCSCEVSPTAARDQRTFLVVKVGFGGREWTAHAHHALPQQTLHLGGYRRPLRFLGQHRGRRVPHR